MIYRSGPTPAGTCPRCRETLLRVERSDQGIFEGNALPDVRWCETCGGVLAGLEASRRIVASFSRDLLEVGFLAGAGKRALRDDGRLLSCPECLTQMAKIRVSAAAVEVDACPAHGTWFDAGELEAVTRAYARARRAGVLTSRQLPDVRVASSAAPPDAEAARAPPTTLLDVLRGLLGL